MEGRGVLGEVIEPTFKYPWSRWIFDNFLETRRGWVGRMNAGVPGSDSSVNPGLEFGALAIGGKSAVDIVEF